MAQRADPERLYIAHRMGLVGRLVSVTRINEHSAERWVTAWEAEAARRGLDRRIGHQWWDPGWNWIADQRRG
jgi:hypothetical protein